MKVMWRIYHLNFIMGTKLLFPFHLKQSRLVWTNRQTWLLEIVMWLREDIKDSQCEVIDAYQHLANMVLRDILTTKISKITETCRNAGVVEGIKQWRDTHQYLSEKVWGHYTVNFTKRRRACGSIPPLVPLPMKCFGVYKYPIFSFVLFRICKNKVLR